jgi:hypothetical protein
MRHSFFALTLLLSACVASPRAPAADAGAAPFPVMAFFDGGTEGRAVLKIAFRSPQQVIVHGRGRVENGTLLLHQIVKEGDKPPRERQWRIREVSPGHYAGSLSDATGPIKAEADGNRLHLTFRMKGGFDVEQWLVLAPDGKSAHNIMAVRKLGVRVATLDETIRKVG